MPSRCMQSWRRPCGACGGLFVAAPQRDGLQHTCLTCVGGALGGLPDTCWQRMAHRYAKDMLEAIPAHRQKSKEKSAAHHRRLRLAMEILALTESEPLRETDAVKLVIEFGKNAVAALLARIKSSSPLYEAVAPAFAGEMRRRVPAPNRVPISTRAPLPPDFEAAVQSFAAGTRRKRDVRRERGHSYSELTVRRRELDARRFCEFLVQQGLEFWPQVSQQHIDLYVTEVNNKAGERAHTFLMHVKRKYRLTQNIIRPRFRRKPPSDAMVSAAEMMQILRTVVACKNVQVVVAALMLMLWGQTIARCHALTTANFRLHGDQIEVLFAEQWTPLDALTSKFLKRLHPAIGAVDPGDGDAPVFAYSIWTLNAKVREAVGVPVKKLRMSAIANLIRSGITDRGAISRITGVSMGTVGYIEKAFAWDLQMTVDPEIVKSRNEVIRGERTE